MKSIRKDFCFVWILLSLSFPAEAMVGRCTRFLLADFCCPQRFMASSPRLCHEKRVDQDKNLDPLLLHKGFADPTDNFSFKKLFATPGDALFLKSLLNHVLILDKGEEIIGVEVKPESLNRESPDEIGSAVDVLCETNGHRMIAVEMQNRYESYFLARSQAYMAKLIAGQVQVGQGKIYHKKMLDTYIVCIGNQDIFHKDDKLAGDGDHRYEKTVVPMIKEFGVVVPSNKMNWKFYELNRFKKYMKDHPVTVQSPLKEQWLKFFIECQDQKEIPEEVDRVIRKAYELMNMEKWTEAERILYWKSQANRESAEAALEEQRAEGLKEGRKEGEKLGMEKGIEQGRAEGREEGKLELLDGLLSSGTLTQQQYDEAIAKLRPTERES